MPMRVLLVLAILASGSPFTYTLESGRVRMVVDARWEENRTGARDDRHIFELTGQGDPRLHGLLWIEVLHKQSVEAGVAKVFLRMHPVKRIPFHDSKQDACILSYGEGSGPWVAVDRIARRADITIHARIAWRTDSPPRGLTTDSLVEQANALIAGIEVDGTPIGAVARLVEARRSGNGFDLVEVVR